jgi:hypothetical protein
MSIERAFGFITDDDEWITKIVIGGLIFLIPLIGQLVVTGYVVEIARRVMRDHPTPLPNWSDFGKYLSDGFADLVIWLVYFSPLLLAGCATFLLPLLLAPAGEEAAAGALGLMFFCVWPILSIFSLVLTVFGFAGTVRYVQTDSLGAALQVGEVVGMVRADMQTYLIILGMSILAGLIASAGLFACGVGFFFAHVYGQAALGHTLGQAAARGAAPASDMPIPPPSGYNGPAL